MKPDKPWWLKQRRFVIPTMLKDKIQELPEVVQKFYCFIVSKIVIETKKHPHNFDGISSRYFKNGVGSDYRDYINQLLEWDIIKVNESYLNSDGKGFPKSYRLHPTALKSPKVRIDFKKKPQPLKDKSALTDDVAEFVFKNLKLLTVKADLVKQDNITDEVDAEDEAEKIYYGVFDVHYGGKAKRLFHSVILMSKLARRNLMLKGNPLLPLYEYDIKSCMPVILLGVTDDPAEKAHLKLLLDDDIYRAIAKEQGVTKERDVIKTDFLRFVNGGVSNYVSKFFHAHLPVLAECIVANRMKSKADKGMAWFGQRVESEIMAREVPRHLLASMLKTSKLPLTCGGESQDGLFYVPMHDGWLGVERDEQVIAAVVKAEFLKRLNYRVIITRKELTSGIKTLLPA